MLDIKTFKSALEQLESERKIPKEKILDAIEQAMAAAYKKDYGKRGQIIRAKFDSDTGEVNFFQIKIVVDETIAKIDEDYAEKGEHQNGSEEEYSFKDEGDERVRFNSEHHILLEDARRIKKDAELNDEMIFPLEARDDYGRIAAQTAKQVIIQKIREAERTAILDEYGEKEGEVLSGIVQKIERGNIFVDFNRAVGVLSPEEQIPREYFERGQRIKAYLFSVEDTPRGVSLRLSRTHPKFLEELFKIEAPEIENGIVEIKSVAREAGARSKIAVYSKDEQIDPVGSCVGQRGTRVNTVSQELGGEKIDIIPWSEDPKVYISNSISPAKVMSIEINDEEHRALVEVPENELSLAIGKGGQNVRLAAKLTGWRIDIKGNGEEAVNLEDDETNVAEDDGSVSKKNTKGKKKIKEESKEEEKEEASEDAEEKIEEATEKVAEEK